MKKYEIEIDGQLYHVKVRELPDDAPMNSPEPTPEKAVPKPATPPEEVHPSDRKITAPMAGTILRVLVEPGQHVQTGDQLLILEAMKMENEIIAPQEGTIKEIFVKPNENVDSDQILITF